MLFKQQTTLLGVACKGIHWNHTKHLAEMTSATFIQCWRKEVTDAESHKATKYLGVNYICRLRLVLRACKLFHSANCHITESDILKWLSFGPNVPVSEQRKKMVYIRARQKGNWSFRSWATGTRTRWNVSSHYFSVDEKTKGAGKSEREREMNGYN